MLGLEKRIDAMRAMAGVDEDEGAPTVEKKTRAAGESGKMGVVIAFLAILVAIGLYLSHDMRLSMMQSDLTDKLAAVQSMDTRIAGLDKRLKSIESLPDTARKMYVDTAIADIKQRAAAVSAMATEDQKAALAKIDEILNGLEKKK